MVTWGWHETKNKHFNGGFRLAVSCFLTCENGGQQVQPLYSDENQSHHFYHRLKVALHLIKPPVFTFLPSLTAVFLLFFSFFKTLLLSSVFLSFAVSFCPFFLLFPYFFFFSKLLPFFFHSFFPSRLCSMCIKEAKCQCTELNICRKLLLMLSSNENFSTFFLVIFGHKCD